MSELQIFHIEWPDLLPIVYIVINNSPSAHRVNVCSQTSFMRNEATPPTTISLSTNNTSSINTKNLHVKRLRLIYTFLKVHARMRKYVQKRLQNNLSRSRKAASMGELPKFMEINFVLVTPTKFFADKKLKLRWRGPRNFTKVLNNYV